LCSNNVSLLSRSTLINCSDDTLFLFGNFTGVKRGTSTGQMFFTYVTPIIFIIGLVGNILSLMVFLTKNMRRLSASLYLAAISSADLMALLFYVLIEWLRRGGLSSTSSHVTVPFLERNGVCHVILFLTYNFRFLSSWLVVCLT
jgi:hypothetical protein